MSNVKQPHDTDLARLAVGVIHREVSRQIGPEGLDTCLQIGALLSQLLPAYEQYAQQVSQVEITLDHAAATLNPAVWAAMSARKQNKFLKAVQAEAGTLNSAIRGHIAYLTAHRQQIAIATPAVQQRIADMMLAMQHLPPAEPVADTTESLEVAPHEDSEIE